MGIFQGITPFQAVAAMGANAYPILDFNPFVFSLKGTGFMDFSRVSRPSSTFLTWGPKLFPYFSWVTVICIFLGWVVFLEIFLRDSPLP